MRLSLIVCTYNRSALLGHCLESIATQTADASEWELIVVDNRSSDDTASRVRAFAAGRPNVRYAYEEEQGLSAARNRGAAEARGEYLAYVDDDARLPSGYLERVLARIESERPDLLGGPIHPYYTTPKPGWFRDEYEIRRSVRETGWSTSCSVSGSNFVIRAALLRELGGFDLAFGMKGEQMRFGEERKVVEEYRRRTPLQRQRVWYDQDCVVEHHVPPFKMSRAYMIRRYYEGGKMREQVTHESHTPGGYARLYVRYPRTFVNLLRKNYRRNGLLRMDWLDVARHVAFHVGRVVESSGRVRDRLLGRARLALGPGSRRESAASSAEREESAVGDGPARFPGLNP